MFFASIREKIFAALSVIFFLAFVGGFAWYEYQVSTLTKLNASLELTTKDAQTARDKAIEANSTNVATISQLKLDAESFNKTVQKLAADKKTLNDNLNATLAMIAASKASDNGLVAPVLIDTIKQIQGETK
jgi:hypothetical protein